MSVRILLVSLLFWTPFLFADPAVVVGSYDRAFVEPALAAAKQKFNESPMTVMRYFYNSEVHAAVALPGGAALFQIDVKWSNQNQPKANQLKTESYLVRIGPNPPARVELYKLDNEDSPAKTTPDFQMAMLGQKAVRDKLSPNMRLPGIFAGGGAPEVTDMHVSQVYLSHDGNGAVVVELTTNSVTFGEQNFAQVVDIQHSQAAALTEMFRIYNLGELTELELRAKAKDAAIEYFKKHHVPQVTSISADVTKISELGGTDFVSLAVELTYIDRGFSGLKEKTKLQVDIHRDGHLQVLKNCGSELK